MPEENIASVKYGSRTIQGELRSVLLDDDNTSYDMEKGIPFFVWLFKIGF